MKVSFELDLNGRDWWRPYLLFWVLFLAVYVPIVTMPGWAHSLVARPRVYFLVLLALITVIVLIEAIYAIVFLRIFLPRLSVDGRHFDFRGSIGRFLVINLVGYLLTIITATVYAPWYARRVVAYLLSETTFDGSAPEFLGRGGRLFVYFLLAFWLPVVVIVAAAGLIMGLTWTGGGSGGGSVTWITFLVWAVTLIVMVPFGYLVYKWCVNIRWNDTSVRWQTRFWPACGFVLGQVLLVLITATIYWPAAALRVYRYFAGRTAFLRGDGEIGRLGFEGPISRGFGLIWGQTLLSAVTAGVYVPWAVAAVWRWIVGGTSYRANAG